MEENKRVIEDELEKIRKERKRIEPLLEEMETSIKDMNKKISILRKEIRGKNEEIDQIEDSRRKTINNKRELQGLMRVKWSEKRKWNKRSKNN